MRPFFQFVRLVALLCLALTAVPAAWAQQAPPVHLRQAQELLERLEPRNTSYIHGLGHVQWRDPVASHADCSGFVDQLLGHTYGLSSKAFARWLGSRNPTARQYFMAMRDGNGFAPIERLSDLQPGDFIAVNYLKRKDNTGHLMLVAQAPVRRTASAPLRAGTEQWAVQVIDSSASAHGSGDARHKSGRDGRDRGGLGQGELRMYADAEGRVVGFAWSTLAVSQFKGPQSEPLVMGRLLQDWRP